MPPLFLASVRRNSSAVRLLLSHGASPDIADAVGRTPVQLNASAEFQSWPCAAALVEYGARIRAGPSSITAVQPRIRDQRVRVSNAAAVDLCPELADRQSAVLRDSLTTLATYCARHRDLVARRADQDARQAAAASAARSTADAHFRGFDAATRFFRRTNPQSQHGKTSGGGGVESMRQRTRRDSSATIGGRRGAAATSGAELSYVEIERESTTWIEGVWGPRGDEDSISSTHSGGRLSFTFRAAPTLTSLPPGSQQYDEIGVEFSTASGLESEKVCRLNYVPFWFGPSEISRQPTSLGSALMSV